MSKTIRRQRHELAKYVRRSAYEIAAWRQDIGFLTDRRDFHLERAGTPPPPDDSKVVSIETLSFPKERAAFRHIAPS